MAYCPAGYSPISQPAGAWWKPRLHLSLGYDSFLAEDERGWRQLVLSRPIPDATKSFFVEIGLPHVNGEAFFDDLVVELDPDPMSAPPKPVVGAGDSPWVPLDITSACNAAVVQDGVSPAKGYFTAGGRTLVTSQWHKTVTNNWHRKHDDDNQGLPDDGRVAIPASNPQGWFQIPRAPGKDVILLSDRQGRYPQPVRFELLADQQKKYERVALLHCSDSGGGVVAVTALYDSGAPGTFEVPVHDRTYQSGKLAANEAVAIKAKDTSDLPVEMCTQTFPLDPGRVLKSLAFSVASRTPLKGQADEESALKFRAGIFAISALPAEARTGAAQPDAGVRK
jgi:hypothetical protein